MQQSKPSRLLGALQYSCILTYLLEKSHFSDLLTSAIAILPRPLQQHSVVLHSLSEAFAPQCISGSTSCINCLKFCPLALTQAWSHFIHWSIALSTMVSLKSAETLRSRCYSSARLRVVRSSVVRLLLWKPHSWHSTYIKLYKHNQSAIKCRCIL